MELTYYIINCDKHKINTTAKKQQIVKKKVTMLMHDIISISN